MNLLHTSMKSLLALGLVLDRGFYCRPVGMKHIYAGALDNIYKAMKRLRLVDRFGFNLPKGSGNYRLGGVVSQVDSASEQHVLIPAIAASRLLWLSTGGAQSTSPRRLILACESKNTRKNKKDYNQIADE